MKPKLCRAFIALLLLSTINHPLSTVFAQGTAFTYQGRLLNGTNFATGTFDLRFALYGLSSGGSQIGPLVTNVNTAISNGLFTATLDFGSQYSAGLNRWIEIAVRSNTVPTFTMLTPRQPINATPYAMFAGGVNSSTIVGQLSSSTLGGTYSGFITMNNPGNVLAGDGAGLTSLNASQITSGTVPSSALGGAWKTNGNTGANPANGAFLGTTDNLPFELKVKATRALRVEPTTDTPNLIGGYSNNLVTNGIYGAFIGGGGSADGANQVGGNYAAILGGYGNVASGFVSFVVGAGCIASGPGSVAMNDETTASGPDSLATGVGTEASGNASTAMGAGTTASAPTSFAIGDNTTASGSTSTAMGESTIASGVNATAMGESTIASGVNATAMGELTTASGTDSTAMGGSTLATNVAATAMGAYSIAGGIGSTATGIGSKATGDGATAVGISSVADGYGSFSAGKSCVSGGTNAVAMGFNNIANGHYSVAMGYGNTASLFYATAIGFGNTASGNSSIAMGFQNTAVSGVAMGAFCTSTTPGCMAVGNQAFATNTGCFVWSDGSVSGFGSTGIRQFLIKATGGVGINKNNPATALDVAGTVSATTFNPTSDRNAKENFSDINPLAVLEKVTTLKITRWNFKGESVTEHVGPMAQDFHAAFNLGLDDKHIATVDADGIALAAIQGLNQKVQEKDAKIADLEARLEKLEHLMTEKAVAASQ